MHRQQLFICEMNEFIRIEIIYLIDRTLKEGDELDMNVFFIVNGSARFFFLSVTVQKEVRKIS
jgi:hypothetical protein